VVCEFGARATRPGGTFFTPPLEPPILGPMRSNLNVKALGILLLAAAACGGAPPPNDKLMASVAAARSAREVGAENAPQAALHLKLADEEIAKAKALIKDGDNQRAEYTLIRAKADAELALSLAKEATAKAEAQQAEDQIKSLQNQ
jgi:hypothetical protein